MGEATACTSSSRREAKLLWCWALLWVRPWRAVPRYNDGDVYPGPYCKGAVACWTVAQVDSCGLIRLLLTYASTRLHTARARATSDTLCCWRVRRYAGGGPRRAPCPVCGRRTPRRRSSTARPRGRCRSRKQARTAALVACAAGTGTTSAASPSPSADSRSESAPLHRTAPTAADAR